MQRWTCRLTSTGEQIGREHLADKQFAALKAKMQQPSAAFGHFRLKRMLQDQHRHLVLGGSHPNADTGRLRTLTSGAPQAPRNGSSGWEKGRTHAGIASNCYRINSVLRP